MPGTKHPPDMNDGSWHLDKKVPLALIFAISIQTAAALWWASSVNERVGALERITTATAPQGDRLTRVEVKIENVQSGVDEIKALIRGNPDPVPPRARGGNHQ